MERGESPIHLRFPPFTEDETRAADERRRLAGMSLKTSNEGEKW